MNTLRLSRFVATSLWQSLGMEPQHICGSTFGSDLERDTKAYAKLVKDLNLKAE